MGPTSWPPVGREEREWTSRLDPGHLSVYERIRYSRPYRAAVPPFVADQPVDLSPETRAQEQAATAELVRFDAEMSRLPVPMPSVLLRTESASSSQIEHLTSSARTVALAELGAGSKENADLVVANTRAMRAAMDAGDTVTTGLVLEVQRTLLVASDPEAVGGWRREQVWIGSSGAAPHDADFVPPHADRVPALMDDLVVFAGRGDVPPLAHAALVHAQFETVHPFIDGNGRTGRVLVHTVLRGRGITRSTTVPVSAGLLRAPDRYVDALTAYRAGDPEPIVREMSAAALAAVANGRELAEEITALREEWRQTVHARADSSAWLLADLLITQPVVNAEHVARSLGVSMRTALTTIATLTETGVLVPGSDARRNRVWQAPRVLAAVDAFARRAGRRRPQR